MHIELHFYSELAEGIIQRVPLTGVFITGSASKVRCDIERSILRPNEG